MKKIGRIFAGISAVLFCGGLSTFLSHGISLLNTPKTAEISAEPHRGGGAEPLIDPGSGSSPQNEITYLDDENQIIQVDFIQSSGGAYVNLGMQGCFPTPNSKVSIDFSFNSNAANAYMSGIYNGKEFAHLRVANSNICTQSYTGTNIILGGFDTQRHNFEVDLTLNSNNIFFDGEPKGTYENYSVINSVMTLFTAINDNTISNSFRAEGKIYGAEYTYDNNIVRSLIPCYNKNIEEYGLYDTVTEEFFGNAGAGKLLGKSFLEEGETCKFLDYEQYFVDHDMVEDISTTTIMGTGAESDPYILNSSEDMWWASKYIDYNKLDNKYIQLGANVVLNEEKFDEDGNVVPGTSADGRVYRWKRWDTRNTTSFDGKGHSIYGCYYINPSDASYMAMFYYLKELKNLTGENFYLNTYGNNGTFCMSVSETLENCHLLSGTIIGRGSYIAGFAKSARIAKNCTNYAYLNSAWTCSGIVNSCEKSIENCINYGKIVGKNYSCGIGNAPLVRNCTNYGSITGGWASGGISGSSNFESVSFVNCKSYGDMRGADSYSGGIMGAILSSPKLQYLSIIDCEFAGMLKLPSYAYMAVIVTGIPSTCKSVIVKNFKANYEDLGRDVFFIGDVPATAMGVFQDCQIELHNYSGGRVFHGGDNAEFNNIKITLHSSSSSQKLTLLDLSKTKMRNVFVETDFTVSNNSWYAKTVDHNGTIIQSPTQKLYCGNDFSGFNVSWKTGEIRLNSMSAQSSFTPRLTESNLLSMGYVKK